MKQQIDQNVNHVAEITHFSQIFMFKSKTNVATLFFRNKKYESMHYSTNLSTKIAFSLRKTKMHLSTALPINKFAFRALLVF